MVLRSKLLFSLLLFASAFLTVAAHAKSPAPAPALTDTSVPRAPTKPYENKEFHLAFNYPEDWNVVVSTQKPNFIILLLYKGPAKSAGEENLRIDVYKNSKLEEETFDSDAGGVKYNDELKLGDNWWKVFNQPLKPKANTIPIYYLRKFQNSNLYVVSAIDATKLNPIQTQIVSSFRLE